MKIYRMLGKHIKIKTQNLNLILYERFLYGISPRMHPINKLQIKIPTSIARTPSPAIEKNVPGEINPCSRLNRTNIIELINKTLIRFIYLSMFIWNLTSKALRILTKS
jgi:hypothetical protein